MRPVLLALLASAALTACSEPQTSDMSDAGQETQTNPAPREPADRDAPAAWQDQPPQNEESQTAQSGEGETTRNGPASEDPELTLETINAVTLEDLVEADAPQPVILKAQILLDRANISPGVIDGWAGENVAKAVRAFEEREGMTADGALDAEMWSRLSGLAGSGDVVGEYEITAEDVEGPFNTIPSGDYKAMSEMERLTYESPAEMLAERFHMDQELLERLNEDADFSEAGTVILVARPGAQARDMTITRIVADKSEAALKAYNANGDFVLSYPATIGSEATPSPSGTHTVLAVAPNPNYTYNPDVNFDAGVDKKLILPPGPNGPVGSTWIDLSEETYGIHGAPDPDEIDKTASHGCIRLTNWDAEELGKMVVAEETKVEFVN